MSSTIPHNVVFGLQCITDARILPMQPEPINNNLAVVVVFVTVAVVVVVVAAAVVVVVSMVFSFEYVFWLLGIDASFFLCLMWVLWHLFLRFSFFWK